MTNTSVKWSKGGAVTLVQELIGKVQPRKSKELPCHRQEPEMIYGRFAPRGQSWVDKREWSPGCELLHNSCRVGMAALYFSGKKPLLTLPPWSLRPHFVTVKTMLSHLRLFPDLSPNWSCSVSLKKGHGRHDVFQEEAGRLPCQGMNSAGILTRVLIPHILKSHQDVG